MKWEKVRLGELYSVHNGLSKGSKFFGTGYPFLSFSTVFNNYFIPDELTDLVQSNEKEQDNYSILRGDVFVTRTSETSDELGMSCVALKDYPNATYNGFTKRMRPIDNNRVLPEYIGYYMRTPLFRGEFRAFSTMTTRASLKNEDLLGLTVALPPVEVQKKIANILRHYDQLIENNQKQIKLLEESAQRLYKEWFVDLRFPGYENVKIVNGVPEGWRKELIGDVFTTVLGGTPARSNAAYWGGDIPWINSGEVNNLRIMKESEFITELGLKKSSAKLMPKHTTVLAITGATLGQVSYTEIETCANQSVVGIIDENEVYSIYLYLYVSDKIWDIIGKATGGAQQHINKDIVMEYTIVLPDENIIARLNAIVEPYFMKIANMYIQNTKLLEARDRLLYKFMSGGLEVPRCTIE